MNKVKKCSIAGISFTLEIDAYETLSAYITSLKNAYEGNPDGEEIIADIEARIAELILSTVAADTIVAKPLIDNIIRQLGSAEQIDEEQAEKNAHNAEKVDQNGNPRIPRRLYRDLAKAKLGGVCAGLGNYFDIDAVWIRLAMFIPLFFSPTFSFTFGSRFANFSFNLFIWVIVGYIILWFVIPAASSARQKLEMMGEKVTARNIGDQTHNTEPIEPARTILSKVVSTLGRIMLILLKIFVGILFILLLGGGAILVLVTAATIPLMAIEFSTGVAALGFALMLLIPLIVLIYLAFSVLISSRPKGKILLVLLILWITLVPILTISALKSPRSFGDTIENLFESVLENDEQILLKDFTPEEIDEWREQNNAQEYTEQNFGTEGVKQMTHRFTIGQERASSHYNNQMHILFCGEDEDVKVCEETLTFGSGELSFTTAKGSMVKAGKNGIDFNGEKLTMVSKSTIGIDGKDLTTTYNFSVDGVKVQFQQGPLIDMSKVNKELIKSIFGATSKIFDTAGNIIGMAGNVVDVAANIVGNKAVAEAREELREAQKQVAEAQKEVAKAQNEIAKAQKEITEEVIGKSDALDEATLSEPTKGLTTATKTGTETWATNPKVYYYPAKGNKIVKGYSHDGVYVLFYGSSKDVDVCISHAAIDENGYVSTWTKDGNQYLISKYGIKALKKRDEKSVSVKFNKSKTISAQGDEHLIVGEIDGVAVRYLIGDKNNPTTKQRIADLSQTSYVQSLF